MGSDFQECDEFVAQAQHQNYIIGYQDFQEREVELEQNGLKVKPKSFSVKKKLKLFVYQFLSI